MKKRGFSTKAFVLVLALVLALGCVIGGTIAWLTAKTDSVVNTFTVGDISITLTETGAENNANSYKMVPGCTIDKDPVVTVEAGSEDCWLFVKIEEANDLDSFISYTVDSGWTALPGQTGVYYREVGATTTDTEFAVLTGNQVTVKDDVTKEKMEALTPAAYPTLTFTAYAVQKDKVATAADAWAKANSSTNP